MCSPVTPFPDSSCKLQSVLINSPPVGKESQGGLYIRENGL